MAEAKARLGLGARVLNAIEWAGNKLPDPAMIFVWLIGVLIVTVIYNLFAWPFTSMIPVIGRDRLHLGRLPAVEPVGLGAEHFGDFGIEIKSKQALGQ